MVDSPAFVGDRLRAIEEAGLFRRPPIVDTEDGVHGTVDGHRALLFCSNDYLGLRFSPVVRAGAVAAAERFGTGSGSSRLIAGSLPIHRQLEESLADWMGTEAALVCSSGYQANIALLQGLGGPDDLLLSDARNHASIIDGCRLAKASVEIVRHRDRTHLAELLAGPSSGMRFIVGEGLYSMDGDRGDVAGWTDAALGDATGQTFVLVDEAHSLGLFGPGGTGVCAEGGLETRVLARVGTFGKALGSHGAFVVCAKDIRELLVNTARTYIFTTGLSPTDAGAALAAIGVVRSDQGADLRARLGDLVRRFRTGLQDLDLSVVGGEDSPIVPVIVGEAERAMALHRSLLQAGVYAMAIRPPTVPHGGSRLRFTVTAAHDPSHIDRALTALARA